MKIVPNHSAFERKIDFRAIYEAMRVNENDRHKYCIE